MVDVDRGVSEFGEFRLWLLLIPTEQVLHTSNSVQLQLSIIQLGATITLLGTNGPSLNTKSLFWSSPPHYLCLPSSCPTSTLTPLKSRAKPWVGDSTYTEASPSSSTKSIHPSSQPPTLPTQTLDQPLTLVPICSTMDYTNPLPSPLSDNVNHGGCSTS